MPTRVWTGAHNGNYGLAANWVTLAAGVPSVGAVPIAGDDVVFIDNAVSVTGGLDQSAVALTSITVDLTYTGQIGTDADYLKVDVATADIGTSRGVGTPSGSPRLKIDFGSGTAVTATVYGTATTGLDDSSAPVQVLSTDTASNIHVRSGIVSIGAGTTDTASVSTIYCGRTSEPSTGPTVVCGPACTCTALIVSSGSTLYYGVLTSATVNSGTLTVDTSDAIGTATIYDGTLNLDRHNTITNLYAYGGVTDCLRTKHTKAITDATIYAGATIRINLDDTEISNNLTLGERLSLSVTAA